MSALILRSEGDLLMILRDLAASSVIARWSDAGQLHVTVS